ncbi:uncharacterized protein LOC134193925 isoform X2 [Corticium candelabrum]|nr:uncharacterized protein LOC134193925 isoform X2 [Corticium candelabrum]
MNSVDVQAGDLVRELARERQLRLEAERTARDLRIECDRFKVKIQETQKSFDKIHSALEKRSQDRLQIDTLKQEKEIQQQAYEINLSRLREQIKLLESQKATLQMQLEEQRFRPPVDGDRERSQLLLRIARLERGNSQLMNDMTTQRHQFDKCLDKFATQVTQALMEQKSLKRENNELHRRNAELVQMISCREGRLSRSSQDFSADLVNSIRTAQFDRLNGHPDANHPPGRFPKLESLPRRTFVTPPRRPPPKLKLRGSSEDVHGGSVKMKSPVGVPTPHSPGAGGVLPMRRVQSDQTPSLNDSDGRDNDNAYCVQMMHRTESIDSLSSECSDVPVINYWEMYQERQQRTVIPESLRQYGNTQRSNSENHTSGVMVDTQVAVNSRDVMNKSNFGSISPHGRDEASRFPAKAESITDLSDPATRAKMLDAMLGSQSDDEDFSEPSDRDQKNDADSATFETRDEFEYLRCIRRRNLETLPQHPSVIKFSEQNGFLRYGADERSAIKRFEFLQDLLSDCEPVVTDAESSDDERSPKSSLGSMEKLETSSASTIDADPSPKRSLSSERIGQLLNGMSGRTFLSYSQPNINETANCEKKVSKVAVMSKHATSLTTVVENGQSRSTRSPPSQAPLSPSRLSYLLSRQKSPSPQRVVGEVSYGVTIRDNRAAQRLSLSPGEQPLDFTPVNTPEPPRRSSSRSTLI